MAQHVPATLCQTEFHSLYPLDPFTRIHTSKNISKVYKLPTEMFKALQSSTGTPCAIRRVMKSATALQQDVTFK